MGTCGCDGGAERHSEQERVYSVLPWLRPAIREVAGGAAGGLCSCGAALTPERIDEARSISIVDRLWEFAQGGCEDAGCEPDLPCGIGYALEAAESGSDPEAVEAVELARATATGRAVIDRLYAELKGTTPAPTPQATLQAELERTRRMVGSLGPAPERSKL